MQVRILPHNKPFGDSVLQIRCTKGAYSKISNNNLSRYQTGANPWTYKWQRFAIPVLSINNANKPTNDYTDQALFGGATTFKSYLYGWNGNGWEQPANGWTDLEPLRGYQISNNTVSGGITYYFTGNLVGNADGNYEFQATGFDFFGNSYTAPINVEALLNTFDSQSGFEASR